MSKENNSQLWKRVCFDLCLFASICWFPWWVSIVLAAVASFFFTDFVELVCAGLLIDTLYAPHQTFSIESYTYFFLALVLFFVLSLVKRQLR